MLINILDSGRLERTALDTLLYIVADLCMCRVFGRDVGFSGRRVHCCVRDKETAARGQTNVTNTSYLFLLPRYPANGSPLLTTKTLTSYCAHQDVWEMDEDLLWAM